MIAAGYSIEDSLAVLTKLSSDIMPVWSKKTAFAGTALAVTEIAAERYAIAGYSGSDGFSAIFDEDGVVVANAYGADLIRPGDIETITDIFTDEDGLILFGNKEDYGVEAHGFLIKTDELGESCCSSPLSMESTSFVTSTYAVTPDLTAFSPMISDTSFTISPMGDARINSICPR